MYETYGSTSDAGLSAAIAGLSIGILLFVIAIVVAAVIFSIICDVKIFQKAGKPGWAAIVPYYSQIVMLDIIGYKWYYIFVYVGAGFLGSIPYIGYIASLALILFAISMNIKLAKSFGKDVGFGIGLTFLGIVFLPILAFSKDIKYVGQTVKGDIDFNDLF